jgi:hypothetical protein
MSEARQLRIPRHGKAGSAFLGVNLRETKLLLFGVGVGAFLAFTLDSGNAIGLLAPSALGYFANRLYLDWKQEQMPGFFKERLYHYGLISYGAHKKASRRNSMLEGSEQAVYVGNQKPRRDLE